MAIAGGLDELSGDMEDEREDVGQRDGLPRGVEVFRIEGPLFFGVADELLDILRRVGPTPKAVILRMRRVPLLDASGAAALEQIVTQACAAGTHIIFSGTQAQPLDMLRRHSLGLNGRQVTHRASFTEALQLAAAIADPSTDPKGSTLS